MEQKKCPKCGAMNDSLANFCHSCFAILVPTGGADLGDAGYASGRIEPIQPTANPVSAPAPAPGTPAQPQQPYSPFPTPPAQMPSQTPMRWQPTGGTSTRRRKAALPIGIFVILFFIFRLLTSGVINSSMFSSNPEPVQPSYHQPSGFTGPLPNNVGDYSRLGSGKVAKVATTYSSKTDPSGTGALYVKGSGKPDFLVATLPSLAGYPPPDLLDVMTSGFDTNGAVGSGIGSTITKSIGDTSIACAPITAPSAPLASACATSSPSATAVVFAYSADAQSTMNFTEQLSKAI